MDSIKELLGHWKAKDTKCFKALQSIVDAVGTCGECKHFGTHKQTLGINIKKYNCKLLSHLRVEEDFYCANFERKESE